MVAHRTPKNEPHARTSRTLFRMEFARTRTRATAHRTCACAHAPSQLIPWYFLSRRTNIGKCQFYFAYFCLAMIFSEGDIIRFIFVGTGISLKDEMFANSAGLLLSMSSFLLTSSSRIVKTRKNHNKINRILNKR